MFRLMIILSILGIGLGIVIAVGSGFPDIARIFAPLFCDEVATGSFGMTLRCIKDGNEQQLSGILGMVGSVVITVSALLLTGGIIGGLAAATMKQNRILKNGEPAQAKILDMQYTGTRINGQPMVRFYLQVTPGYGTPYQAETSRVVPYGMMGTLGIGGTVPVKYDRDKPQNVALDFDALRTMAVGNPGMAVAGMMSGVMQGDGEKSLTEKLKELEDSYKQGLINQTEYESMRQKIISQI